MKTLAMTAVAALAALMTVAPVQAATTGELPQYFNDQGEQVPAFPRGRFANTATPTKAQGQDFSAGRLPVTFNDQGQQTPAFPSGVAVDNAGSGRVLHGCLGDIRKAGSC